MNPYTNILAATDGDYRWNYVYLHGKAEDAMAYEYSVRNINEAPDIFAADAEMPKEAGNYLVDLFGRPALAVIAPHHGILGGRVALLGDTEGLREALDIEGWR